MSAHTTATVAVTIDDLPSVFGGAIKLARAGLGISAFGVQVLDLPPDYVTDAHDERATGQEELYAALAGDGAIVLDDGTRHPLDAKHLVRLAPEQGRRVAAGSAGVRVLVAGGVPGAPYDPPAWTEAGS
jgi:hypothetical protein